MTRLWLVRAGKHGEREAAALADNVLAPGFIEVPDLTPAKDRRAVFDKVTEGLPSEGENTRKNFAAQLNQFRNTISIGDIVVMPRKLTPSIAVGRITGPYTYSSDPALRHIRTVDWKRTDVPRTDLKQDLRFSLGAFMTICEVSRNEALKRFQGIIDTGKDLGPSLSLPKASKAAPPDADGVQEAEDAPTDIEDLANQQLIASMPVRPAGRPNWPCRSPLAAAPISPPGLATRRPAGCLVPPLLAPS